MIEVVNGITILGAGGFAREVYHHMRPYFQETNFVFVDDVTDVRELFGCPVIKDWDFTNKYQFIVGVGDPLIKKVLVNKALESGLRPLDTWVHPRALVQDAKLGRGGIICPGAVITTNVSIGNYVTINLNTTIGHDTEIEDYVNISPGCSISGNNDIGEGANIGTGTVTREEASIGKNITIGAQACVIQDCDLEGGVYTGVPAKAR